MLTIVRVDGMPSDIKVLRGVGKGLDQKAIECLLRWRFHPATDYFGEALPQMVQVEINFRLPSDKKNTAAVQ